MPSKAVTMAMRWTTAPPQPPRPPGPAVATADTATLIALAEQYESEDGTAGRSERAVMTRTSMKEPWRRIRTRIRTGAPHVANARRLPREPAAALRARAALDPYDLTPRRSVLFIANLTYTYCRLRAASAT